MKPQVPSESFSPAAAMPETSCRSVASLQKFHGLKNFGGCMTGLSEMFHSSRMPGESSTNLSMSGARSQSSESHTQAGVAEKQNSASAERMSGAESVIKLRKILDAKQEPFVLQDVIYDKRHPVRIQSSRELKVYIDDMVSSSGKSQSLKRTSSKDDRLFQDGVVPASSQENGNASAALVKKSSFPAEAIITLPSAGKAFPSPNVRKTRSSSLNRSMASQSPVKSPNKKALLMEAAARILEGSNRQNSRRSRSSARSFLKELDESNKAQGLSTSNEHLMPMVHKCTIEGKSSSQSITIQDINDAEARPSVHHDADDRFSFLHEYEQNLSKSLNGCLSITDDEVRMPVKGRIRPLDGRNEQSMQLATVPDTFQQPIHVQESDIHVLSVTRTRHETSNTVADHSTEGAHWHGGLRQSDDQIYKGAEPVTNSELEERHHMQCSKNGSVDMCRDLGLALHEDQSNSKFVSEVPIQDLLNSAESLEHSQAHIAKDFNVVAWSRDAIIDDDECTSDCASSRCIATTIESGIDADAYVLSDTDSNGLIELSTVTEGHQDSCEESRSEMEVEMDNVATPKLLLCNYSWWTQGSITQAPSAALQNKTMCDLPTASTEGHSIVTRTTEEGNEGENEYSSTSPDHSYVDEFQQSSPVSVLDAVYDDTPTLGKPFDYFHEARQKLLESVRRYEMLMHMDVDSLMKLNEESLCHEYEEDSDLASYEESWEIDGNGICPEDHPVAIMPSLNHWLSKDADSASKERDGIDRDSAYGYEDIKDDCFSYSDKGLYIETASDKNYRASDIVVDAKAARLIAEREQRRCKALIDCSSKLSNSGVSDGLHCCWQSRSNSSSDISEVEKQTGSGLINAMLQMDLRTSSWSSFHEDEEVMEMELESSLLRAMMQELLSDLLYQVS